GERVVGGNGAVEVDAEDFSVRVREAAREHVRGAAAGVVAAGVSDADVELAVGADGEAAAVVVRRAAQVLHEDLFGGGIEEPAGEEIDRDDAVAVEIAAAVGGAVRVVEEEALVR